MGLRQEQRLTPQLIQSMNILQLPIMALEAKIQEEMERNPALEEADLIQVSDLDGQPPADPSVAVDPAVDAERRHEAEGFRQLERLSREYDFDDSDRPFGRLARHGDGERDAKMDAMANTASRSISLNEYLRQQWAFVEVGDRLRQAGELIINYIDEDGYLRTPLEEIAEQHVPPFTPADVAEALSWVQTLDPPGIAARDLRECLLLQLDSLEGNHELERILVERHLTDIEKNRYPEVVKATGRSLEDIKQAVRNLGRLYPRPGALVVDRDVPPITPDVIVEYSEDTDGYNIRLAKGNNPRLRISETYRRMLADQGNDKNTRDFIRKNLESAGALIDAIHYRRNRLQEVSEEVVLRQKDFFEQGPAGLKVMRMSDLAEKLGCDPSTISRTVADKYMQTPRGIFPLRCFFTGGTETQTGEETSWDSVRARVKEIVDKEDKQDPLSDDVIAARLQAEGITVSRRTIA
ncbi:MAG: RNA polymerase factor sigma-54, partial [Planctomycetes bacterium]|nr:RNA polymerase factor sigma-54 [Planctomycetota bacterium]